MIIWSWQSSECADALEDGRTWRCDAEKASWYGDFDYAYDWMASEMRRRVGDPPDGVRWPIWGWARYEFVDGACPADDDEMVDPHTEADYVRVLLDVPDDLVLLSDEDSWGSILNGFPAEPYEYSLIEDPDELDRKLDELIAMKKDLSADPTEEILATWPNIFDVRISRNDANWRGRYVQATFWEIRPEWVVRLERFHVVPHKSLYDWDYEDEEGDEEGVEDGDDRQGASGSGDAARPAEGGLGSANDLSDAKGLHGKGADETPPDQTPLPCGRP